eukprot:CAMPEP_0184426384 /NCGR_PEP_ID=MMETSP0738-20130409/151318_1 /TAXON_ID=385413 /ORGANISM="Thalassiosira miniscula, Strain CCMP1093" /LENGTH=53 /DNA_ID=CAMNT_0026789573 /DNA_START=166 /DNA_END=327 /DNA_ORIENTATION=-
MEITVAFQNKVICIGASVGQVPKRRAVLLLGQRKEFGAKKGFKLISKNPVIGA